MKIFANFGKTVEKYWLFTFIGAGVVFYLLAVALSVGQPVWFDEGYSLLLAKSSYGELLALTGVDAHPPLYYLLLKLWGSIFGFSEFAIRSLSAVLMSGAVVGGALLLRQMFSTRVALTALPFVLLAPFLLRYGYEVRMYALATVIAVYGTYALVKAKAATTWHWWAVYAVLVALGMYTLYMMAAVWLAHAVWLLAGTLSEKKAVRKKTPLWRQPWVLAYTGAVVLFLPYIPTFIHQLFNSALPGMGNEMTVSQLVNIVSMLTLFKPDWTLGDWGAVLIVAFITTIAVLGVRAYKKLSKKEKSYYLLILALTAVPVVFYALPSLLGGSPVFIVRYMAHSAIFIALLIGVTVALSVDLKVKRAQRARVYVASAGVLAVLVLGVFNLQAAGNFVFERMQQPMTYAVQSAVACGDDTLVIADDPYTYIDSIYYFEDCPLYFYSEENVAYKGGYAMLHNSEWRIASGADVHAATVIHLGWTGKDPQIDLGDRYEMVGQDSFDKQMITRYQLSVE